jgi:hypothetical protein
MTKPTLLLGAVALANLSLLRGQGLDQAEVRIPYGELKQLLARAEPVAKPETPKPALLSARLRLTIENGRPVLEATFRATSFANDLAFIPLIAGDLSLEKQDPEDATIMAGAKGLCLAVEQAGTRTLQLRLLPIVDKNSFSFSLPPCPSVIFETAGLPEDHSVVIGSGGREETLADRQIRPLPSSGQELTVRLLGSHETREALRPPEPSAWTWQHQALVKPSDGELIYQVLARASAADGSGVEALLPLPSDAQDVTVSGEDLASHAKIRGENRSLGLKLVWITRGVLDRQVTISYRMPLRPLDRTWPLQAPGGDGTRTRFIIAASPVFAYSADGLTAPLLPQGLPSALAESLKGATCHLLEATTTAELSVTPIPVAATAEGVVTSSEWSLKIEPDGAMLATGILTVEHAGPLGFIFDTPEGMKLLSCEVAGKPVSPVDLGQGVLKLTLPPQGGKSLLSCSFTGRTTSLDPVEGTLKLTLPKVPLFIHSLLWRLDLPAGYQAETHGNLRRVQVAAGEPPSRVSLKKNLCRDERPEIHIFYQRSDLKP